MSVNNNIFVIMPLSIGWDQIESKSKICFNIYRSNQNKERLGVKHSILVLQITLRDQTLKIQFKGWISYWEVIHLNSPCFVSEKLDLRDVSQRITSDDVSTVSGSWNIGKKIGICQFFNWEVEFDIFFLSPSLSSR